MSLRIAVVWFLSKILMTACRESVTMLIVWHSGMFTAYAMPHPTAKGSASDDVTL